MPTNRRRNRRKAQIGKELEGLFSLGTGWNEVEREKGVVWLRDQWSRHGKAFLKSYQHGPCWALEFFGMPEGKTTKT